MEIVVPWLPGRIYAITLWPFIFYRKGYYTECVRLHEWYHYMQARQWLVIPWYIAYILLAMVYAGRVHPMEREAYKIQRGCEDEG